MIRGGRYLVFVRSCFCWIRFSVFCVYCVFVYGFVVSYGESLMGCILVINWHMWEPEISKSFVLSFYEVLQEMLT